MPNIAALKMQNPSAIPAFLALSPQKSPTQFHEDPLYENNPAFNNSVDEAHGQFRVFEVEFRPSEVLFQMEPQSYRIYLAEFDKETEGDGTEAGAAAADAAEVAP